MKRKKAIMIGVIVAVLLSLGLIGGVALAQTTGTTENQGASLMARVAAILGIDEEKVEAAFNQAQREMELEALESRLKTMVEDGKITQEQADQYKTWWQARPDMPAGIGLPGSGGFRGMRGHGGPGAMIPPSSSTPGGEATTPTP